MLNVAVVGSGPAGLYAAEALVKQTAALPLPVPVRVDVIDRLPTPYGLVRYGVAPDHKSIKSIAQYLRKVLESPDVRFAGGVHLGEDVTRDDLVSAYDAVIYATGAMRDRRLGIPGEELHASKVREVHMIGRRGPAHAKFTTKELRELGELPGVEVVVHGDEADLNAFDLAGEGVGLVESDRRVRGNLVAISKWAQGGTTEPAPSGHSRRLVVRFWLRPVEILGTERVGGITLERTVIAADGAFGGTGEFETLSAQMVLRSV